MRGVVGAWHGGSLGTDGVGAGFPRVHRQRHERDQTSGNTATGTLSAGPSIFDWLTGPFAPASVVTVPATDNAATPLSAPCVVTLRVGLF